MTTIVISVIVAIAIAAGVNLAMEHAISKAEAEANEWKY